MKGRKPKPTHLKLLEGKQASKINKSEPQPIGNLMKAPADLPRGAVPFWNHAIATAPRGLLRRLDQRALYIYSVAAFLHSTASKQLHVRNILQVNSKRSEAKRANPLLRIVDAQALIMLKAASEMGFTPTSRGRIQVREGDLGDTGEPDNEFQEFA